MWNECKKNLFSINENTNKSVIHMRSYERKRDDDYDDFIYYYAPFWVPFFLSLNILSLSEFYAKQIDCHAQFGYLMNVFINSLKLGCFKSAGVLCCVLDSLNKRLNSKMNGFCWYLSNFKEHSNINFLIWLFDEFFC